MQDKALQIVSYEQAQKLKKLGFDWEVGYRYAFKQLEERSKYGWNKNEILPIGASYSAPSIAIALKWFRDVEHIEYSISQSQGYCIVGIHQNTSTIFSSKHTTYEEAESALLDKLIELEMSKEAKDGD